MVNERLGSQGPRRSILFIRQPMSNCGDSHQAPTTVQSDLEASEWPAEGHDDEGGKTQREVSFIDLFGQRQPVFRQNLPHPGFLHAQPEFHSSALNSSFVAETD